MADCIFCRIIAGEIPATVVLRNEHVIAVRDVNPKAPSHILVIPVRHFEHLSDFAENAGDAEIGECMRTVANIGRDTGPGGYRVVANEGRDGGQTVFHLHWHVLAGRRMTWPPG